ncbi:response regulator receiver protein [Bradyrhizobium sp. CCGB12]|uniref:response regulator receiver protein n=1 Tax=Bradyrhizobium sp. CCGB12 TaxID=2949632 RepID=UPI0020B42419|nr:response regulator receiver protein [Bradyrhizobium sp. CCGB12]MCP3392029.1 response regulator receiver protein [Bradyrhizobium sp. CCGB12]
MKVEEAPAPSESIIDSLLRQISTFLRIIVTIVVVVYAYANRERLFDWLSTITHGEAFGVKFDREAAEKKFADLKGSAPLLQGNGEFLEGALARAARVGGAVSGARVLWLDTNLPNNVVERQALAAMNVSVQRALSPEDALKLARQAALDDEPYDLIISNVSSLPGSGPLQKCPVVYTGIPRDTSWPGSPAEFSAAQNRSPPMGFAFAEALASDKDTSSVYMSPERPRLIFYTASNGGIVSTVCARLITNYADILLQGVVSALEEARWKKLPPLPRPQPTPAPAPLAVEFVKSPER